MMIKKILLSATVAFTFTAFGQLAPQASPLCKVEQRIGLSDVTLQYSRPSKNNRTIFGDFLSYDEIWRTGANENTKFTTSDALIFGKDTLKAGTYALYTKPGKNSWDIYFYKDATNWGTPETWKEELVAIHLTSKVIALKDVIETLTIGFDQLTTTVAILSISWDKTRIEVPFSVPTDAKVQANIKKIMAGPSANDLNGAAWYYYQNKLDLKQALEWATKACALRPEAYWMLKTKAFIQAELGDKQAAIETAKLGLVGATKANNSDYINALQQAITDWSK